METKIFDSVLNLNQMDSVKGDLELLKDEVQEKDNIK